MLVSEAREAGLSELSKLAILHHITVEPDVRSTIPLDLVFTVVVLTKEILRPRRRVVSGLCARVRRKLRGARYRVTRRRQRPRPRPRRRHRRRARERVRKLAVRAGRETWALIECRERRRAGGKVKEISMRRLGDHGHRERLAVGRRVGVRARGRRWLFVLWQACEWRRRPVRESLFEFVPYLLRVFSAPLRFSLGLFNALAVSTDTCHKTA